MIRSFFLIFHICKRKLNLPLGLLTFAALTVHQNNNKYAENLKSPEYAGPLHSPEYAGHLPSPEYARNLSAWSIIRQETFLHGPEYARNLSA